MFLRGTEEGILARLARADVGERPMLGGNAWRERVAELLRTRYPIYERADLALDIAGDEAPENTAARLHSLVAKSGGQPPGGRIGDIDAEN